MRRVFPAVAAVALMASSPGRAAEEKEAGGEDHHFSFHFGGGRLGVEAVQISKEVRRLLGAPEDAGVLVNSVQAGSVAAEAGIKPGDVIVEVAGQKVKSVGSIRRALADKEPGQSVPLVVIRDKRSTTVSAKLRERTDVGSMMQGFMVHGGPELHKQLDRLSERLSDVEKRLQALESRK